LDIDKTLDRIISLEIEIENTYISYIKKTDNQSLKQLLYSLLDQEKEHKKRLIEIKKNPSLLYAFADWKDREFSLKLYVSDKKYSESISQNDFLLFLIDKKEKMSKLYSNLSSMARDRNIAFFFTSLAYEEQKHKNWVVNRYELEMLSSF